MHQKKHRCKERVFLLSGEKLVAELLTNAPNLVVEIYAQDTWLQNNDNYFTLHTNNKIASSSLTITPVTERQMAQICPTITPPPIMAAAQFLPTPQTSSYQLPLKAQTWALLLDGINDPGNLGTIIRTADWFGVKNIYASSDCADLYNPKTVQATMGSIFRTQVIYAPLKDIVLENPHLPVYGAFLSGTNIFEENFPTSGLMTIGSEAHGIRLETQPLVTKTVTIQGYGKAESLNATVASGILLATITKNWRK